MPVIASSISIGRWQRRLTLGKVVRGHLRQMRLDASAVLAEARLGTDTVAVVRAAAVENTATLGELVPIYLEAREDELWPKAIAKRSAISSALGRCCTMSLLTQSAHEHHHRDR